MLDKQDIAERMYRPIRCGGLNYDEEGLPYYCIGTRRVSPEAFKEYCDSLQYRGK